MELEQQRAAYEKKGLRVAALTYDSVEILKNFADRTRIGYPLLSDAGSKTIRAFGILNETVQPGTLAYGVPWPGTYVIDPGGTVKERFFEQSYRERFSAGTVLLKSVPDAETAGKRILETRHLKIESSASEPAVHAGDRITLVLDLILPARMHVYTPEVKGYIPVDWKMAESPMFQAKAPQYPAGKMLRLEAIQETLPVYEKRVRFTRDIVFAQEKALLSGGDGQAAKARISGSLRYQACDDKVCYPPAEIPLEWEFSVNRLDTTRVPAELRKRPTP